MKLISTWIKASRKPVMPRAFLEFSNPSDTGTPKLFNGPKVKLKVRRTKELKAIPLFKVKKDRSFHGTGPAMWYRKIAYPMENRHVKAIIIPAAFFD